MNYIADNFFKNLLPSENDKILIKNHYQDSQSQLLAEKVLNQYPKLLNSVTNNYIKNNEVVNLLFKFIKVS